jgi:exodeoxyribonuclease VIII
LETLSTQEDAAIVQIGCCIPHFDRYHIPAGISHEFETTIAYETALSSEFDKSISTMEWWEKQPASTRAIVFSGQNSYEDSLDQFKFWIDSLRSGGAEVAIWGNGSDFDNRLLSYTLASYGMQDVWKFRNNRDLRTLKALFPCDIQEDPINEIKHTALGDARYEARLMDSIAEIYTYASFALRGKY